MPIIAVQYFFNFNFFTSITVHLGEQNPMYDMWAGTGQDTGSRVALQFQDVFSRW